MAGRCPALLTVMEGPVRARDAYCPEGHMEGYDITMVLGENPAVLCLASPQMGGPWGAHPPPPPPPSLCLPWLV